MNRIYYNPKLKKLAQQLRTSGTKAEIKLWNYLRKKQLMGYDFHRQKPIGNYIVDFFCNKLKLAVEIDGYTHRFEKTFDKDILKTKRLNKLGITVLRFLDKDVMNNIEGVITSIQKFVKEYEKEHTPLSPLFRGDMDR